MSSANRHGKRGSLAAGPCSESRRNPDGYFATTGCKITYAPKSKPKSGITYRYYRCADGKRTHATRGEEQINVREEHILEQLGDAVGLIEITAQLAEDIARGLNETHHAAIAAKARSAEISRAELRDVEEKEDRLFDRFDKGEIDRATYDRQLIRVREEKTGPIQKQREDASSGSAYLVTAQRVLELAKNARSLWEGRNPEEKRDSTRSVLSLDKRTAAVTVALFF